MVKDTVHHVVEVKLEATGHMKSSQESGSDEWLCLSSLLPFMQSNPAQGMVPAMFNVGPPSLVNPVSTGMPKD